MDYLFVIYLSLINEIGTIHERKTKILLSFFVSVGNIVVIGKDAAKQNTGRI